MSDPGVRPAREWFRAGFYGTLGGLLALFLVSLLPGLVFVVVYLLGQLDLNTVVVIVGIILGAAVIFLLVMLGISAVQWYRQRK